MIKVKATILPPPPATENIVKRENEMELVANWRFEDFNLTSVDSLDQIQVLIDGQVRGLANIKAVGPFYAAIIKIQGNASDAGKMLQFRVWHGNALTLYEGSCFIRFNPIQQWHQSRFPGCFGLIIVKGCNRG